MENLEEDKVYLVLINRLKKLDSSLKTLRSQIDVALYDVHSIHAQLMPKDPEDMVKIISREIYKYFKISVTKLKIRDRHEGFIEPRHVYFALVKHYTPWSDARVGKTLDRDRNTVNHSVTVIANAQETGDLLYKYYHEIKVSIDEYFLELDI